MQFRKFLLLLSLNLCFSALTFSLYAQEVRVNDKGERIIVYEDGSWQYFFDLIQGNDAIYRETPEKATDFPVFEGQVAPMEGPLKSITEDYAQKIFLRKAQLAAAAADIARDRALKAKEQRDRVEREFEQFSNRPEDANNRRQMENRLQSARQTESRTLWEAQQALVESQRASLRARSGNYLALLKEEQNEPLPSVRDNQQTELLNGNFYDQLGFAGEMAYRPGPSRPSVAARPSCRFAFEGVDEYTGQHRRDVQKELLFTHTDEKLRLYLKDKEYLRCEAFLSSIAGGYRFLSLQFTFAYPNAREAYGFIEAGSFLTIKLINGEYVNLRAGKMDRGHYDTETELLTYQVHYPIDANLLNILKKVEIDTVMVFWSSGYEEYPVFNVDFFIHQLLCLE
jgi:hypothetical protein